MSKLPQYKEKVSLIPYGLPQFLDFEISKDSLSKEKFYFYEEKRQDTKEGRVCFRLHQLVVNSDDKEFYDAVSKKPANREEDYRLAAEDVKPWLNKWIPIPFLREGAHKVGEMIYEKGPTNWARARLSEKNDGTEGYRLVIAFDMQVEDHGEGEEISFALSTQDITNQKTFSLAKEFEHNAWFLNLDWVDEWLKDLWDDYYSKNRLSSNLAEYTMVYAASYLVLLNLIAKASKDIKVKAANCPQLGEGMTDSKSLQPIDVDFVLDIGNSRTTGILVESRVQKSTDLNNSYVLELRDLSRPENIYSEPFATCVEFSQSDFGLESYSRRSGRTTSPFPWHSAVRIGPEAVRLAAGSTCSSGTTGMSSPKRYLWDETDWNTGWCFNSHGTDEDRAVTSLSFDLNDSGIPLCCVAEPRFKASRYLRSQRDNMEFPGMTSVFSRSSLMMLMLMEIIQHALITINSPSKRYTKELPDVPRRLRKIILTLPAGMPITEQNIFRRWADFAVCTLWNALGWQKFYVNQKQSFTNNNYLNRPKIFSGWDEATCTQLVYVFNEIMRNYDGDSLMFFRQKGKRFDKYENKFGVRVATIDMGGGTTDLSVTTYTLENDSGSTTRVAPIQHIRDGFNLAGDDVLKAIVRDVVLKSISRFLENIAPKRASVLVEQTFGKNRMGGNTTEANLRTQFIRQIGIPAAYSILKFYEQLGDVQDPGNITFPLRKIFVSESESADGQYPLPTERVLNYLSSVFEHEIGESFNVLGATIDVSVNELDSLIKANISDMLKNMCEVISAYDCDVLLLTGKPSNWRAFRQEIYECASVAPSRIVPMGSYKVGNWYPYADTFGNISDPKTTVSVGAILSSLAQNSLEGFSFDATKLQLKSTARFVGELSPNGILENSKIWFEVNVDDKKEQNLEVKNGIVEFSSPIVVGFRQLSVERWTATRAYRIEFADSKAHDEAQDKTPYKLKLNLTVQPIEDDGEGEKTEPREEGEISIESIEDRYGNDISTRKLKVLLRTLKKEEDEGSWLDTGVVF